MISKMKMMLKKHKNKLFILMLTLISALTLFLNVGKTYAYETDEFSYTINKNNISTNNQYATIIANDNYIDLKIRRIYIDQQPKIILPLLEDINNTSYNFLINFDILGSRDDTTYESLNSINVDYRLHNFNLYYGNNTADGYLIFNANITLRNQQYLQNNYYTMIFNSNKNAYTPSSFTPLYFNPRLDMLSGYSNLNYWIFRIYNVDYVKSSDIGLQQYYDTYYGQIEENYNQLQQDYEGLQDNYNILDEEYTDLQEAYSQQQEAYDTLQEDYNSLEVELIAKQNELNNINQELEQTKEEYNNIINITSPFRPNNITSSTILFNNNPTDNTITLDTFVVFDYYQIKLNLYNFDLLSNYNPSNNILQITINLEQPIDIGTLKYWCSMRAIQDDSLSIYYYNNATLLNSDLGMNNDYQDTSGNLAPYIIGDTSNVNKLVFEFVLNNNYSQNNLYATEIDYIVYFGTYSQGYTDGLNASNEYIETLKEQYENRINLLNLQKIELEDEINELQDTISVVESSNAMLRDELSTLNENNMTWQKMFFTMADTPLKTVASVLGKDSGNAFLGINLYQTFIGLLTTLAIIWLIKRII